jgi:hypothetical protein
MYWACRALQPAPFVQAGICDLFELYMVHVFVAFSDTSLASIMAPETAEVWGFYQNASDTFCSTAC